MWQPVDNWKRVILGLAILLIVSLAKPSPTNGQELDLEDCLDIALSNHNDIKLARTGIDYAIAAKTGTRFGYLPTISIESSAASTLADGSFVDENGQSIETSGSAEVYYSVGARIRQNIFDGGKWWKRITRAKHEIGRARLGHELVRQEIALVVIIRFFELLTQRKQKKVREKNLALSSDQLRLTESRLEIGTGNQVDVSHAEVSRAEDFIALERQKHGIVNAKIQLNLAIGRQADADISIRVPGWEPSIPKEIDHEGSPNHPRIAQSKIALEVAHDDLSIARADYWPTLFGTAYYQRQSSSISDVYAESDQHHAVGASINLEIPIFSGFSTSGRVSEARVEIQKRELALDQAQTDLRARIAAAVGEIKALGSIAIIEEANIVAAKKSRELIRAQYALGLCTALELRDAQLSATRADLAAVETRYQLYIAIAAYHYAHGDLLARYQGRGGVDAAAHPKKE